MLAERQRSVPSPRGIVVVDAALKGSPNAARRHR